MAKQLISHRGNLFGPSNKENNIRQIEYVISIGYDVEIDVWSFNQKLFLGHDIYSLQSIDIDFLKNKNIWVHAKNFEAVSILIEHPDIHFFYHDKSDGVFTSHGHFWTFNDITNAILIDSNRKEYPVNAKGLCSDYVGMIRKATND